MKHRRTVKLILPGLQLRLILAFVFLSALALLLQYLLVMSALARLASELPNDGLLLLDGLGPLLASIFAVSAGVILPLTILVGLLSTHRFAGPIYRFQVFLRQVIAGERPADCRLRKGDELMEMCSLINQATARARAGTDAAAPSAKPGLRAVS